ATARPNQIRSNCIRSECCGSVASVPQFKQRAVRYICRPVPNRADLARPHAGDLAAVGGASEADTKSAPWSSPRQKHTLAAVHSIIGLTLRVGPAVRVAVENRILACS